MGEGSLMLRKKRFDVTDKTRKVALLKIGLLRSARVNRIPSGIARGGFEIALVRGIAR
jgi:hypothetical protein